MLEKTQSMQLEACLPDSLWKFIIVAIAYVYNHISVRYLKWRTPQTVFLENKPKTLYFCVFGCEAYIFLPIEICANKLVPHSELMIFIGYENNKYCFIYYTQENTIFYSIFDKRLFSRYTNSYTKEYKLYNELLDKTSPKIELLTPNFSGKDGPAPVPILYTPISSIQNNSLTCSPLSSLSYKSIFSPSTPRLKKPIVEIEKTNNVNFNAEM